MPLTEKGEKIKGAMQEQYGKEKGKEVFYASKNKGTISGVDSMAYGHPVVEIAKRVDAMAQRFDAFLKRRADSRKRSDAQQRADAFEEARHPRNAGGVFTTGEGEEGVEDSAKNKKDQEGNPHEELRQGALSKDK